MIGPNGRRDAKAQHPAVVSLLGAYADDELPAATSAEVEAHVRECGECARELRTQLALKTRLMAERRDVRLPVGRAQLLAWIQCPGSDTGAASPSLELRQEAPGALRRFLVRPPGAVSWGGWLVAACVGAVWLLGAPEPSASGMGMVMAPTVPAVVDTQPGPLASAALAEFRRLSASDLPRGIELVKLKAQLPFSVPELRSAHMRLIGAWATEFRGEPAAVLAYRCHNRLVIQYVVSEPLFFRYPRVREVVGSAMLYAAGNGAVNTVAWPDLDSGSFLVGEFTPAQLAAMRS